LGEARRCRNPIPNYELQIINCTAPKPSSAPTKCIVGTGVPDGPRQRTFVPRRRDRRPRRSAPPFHRALAKFAGIYRPSPSRLTASHLSHRERQGVALGTVGDAGPYDCECTAEHADRRGRRSLRLQMYCRTCGPSGTPVPTVANALPNIRTVGDAGPYDMDCKSTN